MASPNFTMPDFSSEWKSSPRAAQQFHTQGEQDLKRVIYGYYNLEESYPGRFQIDVEILDQDWENIHLRIIDRFAFDGSAEDTQQQEAPADTAEAGPVTASETGQPTVEEEEREKVILDSDFALPAVNWVKPVARALTIATGFNYMSMFEEPQPPGSDTPAD